jgi:hypothetical protein
MKLDDYRGVYNSAWVGALMGIVTSSFISLVGFYIVKGSILRDAPPASVRSSPPRP